jgi:hypothetical protein
VSSFSRDGTSVFPVGRAGVFLFIFFRREGGAFWLL